MKYKDFKKDTAYTVASGTNANLTAGDLFWIDSVTGALNLAGGYGGWIDKEDIHETFFGGLDICEAKDYHVITLSNGHTQIFHDSLVSMQHSQRNRIPVEEDRQ